MENFKKTLSTRIKILGCYAAFMSCAYIALGVSKKFISKNDFGDFFSGFQLGLFCVLALTSIFLIAKYTSALKDEKKLKELYIKETDERTRAINEKSGTALYKVLVFVLIGASVISGYFSSTVFFTILAVIVVLITIYSIMLSYYNRTL